MTAPNITLEQLGALRRRASDTENYVLAYQKSDSHREAARTELARRGRLYHEACAIFRTTVPANERDSLTSQWQARLATGWERPASEKVIARFTQILSEYEALCDVALGVQTVQRYLDTQLMLLASAKETVTRHATLDLNAERKSA